MTRLVLIDGNAMMHRSYHALPPMRSDDGRSVHVVYGFISVLIKLFEQLKPTHVAVAFDRPGPTFREVLLPSYQQQRPKMDDDFISQIGLVHQIVSDFGIPIFEHDGFEADDMIGTIAHKATTDQIIIVTGDRDILQLVQDDMVLVFMPTKGISEGTLYGEKEVVERMGVKPKLIIDLKALMGDASDNYPGVAGIGPKTATNLLLQFGSVKNIYKNLEEIENENLKKKLTNGKESAMLGLQLATIRNDAPITINMHAMEKKSLNTPETIAALESFPFPSLIKRITGKESVVQHARYDEKNPTSLKKASRGKSDEQQSLF